MAKFLNGGQLFPKPLALLARVGYPGRAIDGAEAPSPPKFPLGVQAAEVPVPLVAVAGTERVVLNLARPRGSRQPRALPCSHPWSTLAPRPRPSRGGGAHQLPSGYPEASLPSEKHGTTWSHSPPAPALPPAAVSGVPGQTSALSPIRRSFLEEPFLSF